MPFPFRGSKHDSVGREQCVPGKEVRLYQTAVALSLGPKSSQQAVRQMPRSNRFIQVQSNKWRTDAFVNRWRCILQLLQEASRRPWTHLAQSATAETEPVHSSDQFKLKRNGGSANFQMHAGGLSARYFIDIFRAEVHDPAWKYREWSLYKQTSVYHLPAVQQFSSRCGNRTGQKVLHEIQALFKLAESFWVMGFHNSVRHFWRLSAASSRAQRHQPAGCDKRQKNKKALLNKPDSLRGRPVKNPTLLP